MAHDVGPESSQHVVRSLLKRCSLQVVAKAARNLLGVVGQLARVFLMQGLAALPVERRDPLQVRVAGVLVIGQSRRALVELVQGVVNT